jgi:hypothetical protein
MQVLAFSFLPLFSAPQGAILGDLRYQGRRNRNHNKTKKTKGAQQYEIRQNQR